MSDSKTRIKVQKNSVVIVLSIAALVLFVLSFFIKNDESTNVLRLIGFSFIMATIIFRIFKGDFGYKPTREEMEERMFGNKNPEK